MDTHRRRHTLPFAFHLLLLSAFLMICVGATTALAASNSKPKPRKRSPNLAGTWSGQYGGAYTGRFTLRWTQHGSKLSGTIALSKPRGSYGITGKVSGSHISFGAVGAGATYTGSVAGKAMSGHYQTATGGGTWSARKTA